MPTLAPGAGFSGATAQPATIGTEGDVGYDASAIARWDVVPFQDFSTTLDIGVMAWHREGIDRVEFSAEGGSWSSVTSKTTNAATGVLEYVVTVDAADFDDGLIEVRAVVYPNVGVPIVLGGAMTGTAYFEGRHSCWLNANSGASLPVTTRYVSPTGNDSNSGTSAGSPFLTISKARDDISAAQSGGDVGGGLIKLLTGTHVLGNATENWTYYCANRWLTIQPNDGLSVSQVVISGCGSTNGLRTEKVRLRNLTITGSVNTPTPTVDYLWLDGVAVAGSGLTDGLGYADWTGMYASSVTVSNTRYGFLDFMLVRGSSVTTVGECPYRNCGAVINCSAAHPELGDASYHPDVYQHTSEHPNAVCYGFTATDTIDGTFGIRIQPSANGVAMIDLNIVMGQSLYLWEMERPYSNMFFKNCILDGNFTQGGTFSATNLVFEDCTFPTQQPAAADGITFRTTTSAPSAPTNLTATALGATTVRLTWE